MCSHCGCGHTDLVTITKIGDEKNHEHIHMEGDTHHHDHHHDHGHTHHTHAHKTVVDLERDILTNNNLLAERNRGYLMAKNILTLNLVSSPGSGKTSLLERTLVDLKSKINCYVIEGDQQSANDAERIAKTDVPVVQINTGRGCHLDANMVNKAIHQLAPENDSLLFIENVGNLVCPALFDLGEEARVVIISVTEGDDKPIKYPDMFHTADLCIINKIDLLPYVEFDVEKAKEYALRINPNLSFIEVSATRGEGLTSWYDYLKNKITVSA